jgi:hypothetical protein
MRTKDFNLPDFCGKKNLAQRLTFAAIEAWNMRQTPLHNTPLQEGKKTTNHTEP